MMGLYAENLVIRELIGWPEKIEVSYYREKNREVDFVLTHSGNRHLPFEVKPRGASGRLEGLRHFMAKFKLPFGVVITREQTAALEDNLLYLPLRFFLLAS